MSNPAPNAEDLFARAPDFPAGPARAQFVHAKCADNPALLAELKSLLEAHDRAGSFLRDTDPPLPRLPGFRVERKLGQGSLGTVYLAHDEKLNRRVAIKVL